MAGLSAGQGELERMKSFFDFSERYGTRAGGYRDLMRHNVRHVVLVSSLYESFILAEDGHLHERVLGGFVEASLREPPDLTRVSSGREALKLLQSQRPVDLVITSPDVGDMDAIELAGKMDEVLVYNRALSPAEVKRLFEVHAGK